MELTVLCGRVSEVLLAQSDTSELQCGLSGSSKGERGLKSPLLQSVVTKEEAFLFSSCFSFSSTKFLSFVFLDRLSCSSVYQQIFVPALCC